MKLEIEGRSAIDDVSSSYLQSTITGLKSYGPASYASLTDQNGNYLQVVGGGVTCMMERHDGPTGKHFRAYQDKKSSVFSKDTILHFGGGEVVLSPDEWFTSKDVKDTFLAFLLNKELPSYVKWRDMSSLLS